MWERGKQGEVDQADCNYIDVDISIGIGIGIGETIMQNLGHLSSIGGGNSFVFFLSCRWTQLMRSLYSVLYTLLFFFVVVSQQRQSEGVRIIAN